MISFIGILFALMIFQVYNNLHNQGVVKCYEVDVYNWFRTLGKKHFLVGDIIEAKPEDLSEWQKFREKYPQSRTGGVSHPKPTKSEYVVVEVTKSSYVVQQIDNSEFHLMDKTYTIINFVKTKSSYINDELKDLLK